MPDLTHLDSTGSASMVDVSAKPLMTREAVAAGFIHLKPETLSLIRAQALKKGDVLATARIAGIQAAKQTQLLIPLCHQIPLSKVAVSFDERATGIAVTAGVKTVAPTGVEMEALVGASVAALTIYDMCKAVDRGMTMSDIRLLQKHGGQSGSFIAG